MAEGEWGPCACPCNVRDGCRLCRLLFCCRTCLHLVQLVVVTDPDTMSRVCKQDQFPKFLKSYKIFESVCARVWGVCGGVGGDKAESQHGMVRGGEGSGVRGGKGVGGWGDEGQGMGRLGACAGGKGRRRRSRAEGEAYMIRKGAATSHTCARVCMWPRTMLPPPHAVQSALFCPDSWC